MYNNIKLAAPKVNFLNQVSKQPIRQVQVPTRQVQIPTQQVMPIQQVVPAQQAMPVQQVMPTARPIIQQPVQQVPQNMVNFSQQPVQQVAQQPIQQVAQQPIQQVAQQPQGFLPNIKEKAKNYMAAGRNFVNQHAHAFGHDVGQMVQSPSLVGSLVQGATGGLVPAGDLAPFIGAGLNRVAAIAKSPRVSNWAETAAKFASYNGTPMIGSGFNKLASQHKNDKDPYVAYYGHTYPTMSSHSLAGAAAGGMGSAALMELYKNTKIENLSKAVKDAKNVKDRASAQKALNAYQKNFGTTKHVGAGALGALAGSYLAHKAYQRIKSPPNEKRAELLKIANDPLNQDEFERQDRKWVNNIGTAAGAGAAGVGGHYAFKGLGQLDSAQALDAGIKAKVGSDAKKAATQAIKDINKANKTRMTGKQMVDTATAAGTRNRNYGAAAGLAGLGLAGYSLYRNHQLANREK